MDECFFFVSGGVEVVFGFKFNFLMFVVYYFDFGFYDEFFLLEFDEKFLFDVFCER